MVTPRIDSREERSPNRAQLGVIWIVALLTSAVLIHVALVQPYLAGREYDKRFRDRSVIVGEQLERVLKNPDVLVMARVGDELLASLNEVLEEKKKDPHTRANYYIGVIDPIIVLGAAAFLTVTKRKARTEV